MKTQLLLLCALLSPAPAREAVECAPSIACTGASEITATKTDKKSNPAPIPASRDTPAAKPVSGKRDARSPLPPHLFM